MGVGFPGCSRRLCRVPLDVSEVVVGRSRWVRSVVRSGPLSPDGEPVGDARRRSRANRPPLSEPPARCTSNVRPGSRVPNPPSGPSYPSAPERERERRGSPYHYTTVARGTSIYASDGEEGRQGGPRHGQPPRAHPRWDRVRGRERDRPVRGRPEVQRTFERAVVRSISTPRPRLERAGGRSEQSGYHRSAVKNTRLGRLFGR